LFELEQGKTQGAPAAYAAVGTSTNLCYRWRRTTGT
jgi:hypothetical protein